jgi:hypothetical protein
MAPPVENPVTGVVAGSLLVNVWQASSLLPAAWHWQLARRNQWIR